MKLELDLGAGHRYRIAAYGPGHIEVAGQIHSSGILVCAHEVVSPWGPESIADLSDRDMDAVTARQPEIVLLGTGATLVFPDPRHMARLAAGGIGMEVMDTGAACRSFNFLVGEGRLVIAALLQIGAVGPSPR